MDLSAIKNTYYVMRHGQSLANEKRIIVSDPKNGTTGYGLSEKGKTQAFIAAQTATGLGRETLIVASDFLRAQQTADQAATALNSRHPVIHTPLLRERFFGQWELTADTNYPKVWERDAITPDTPGNGVETVQDVLNRVLLCLSQLEKQHSGKTILLVSHGDTLQIFLTHLKGWPPCRHREIPHLGVARIKKALP